jgi:hypothetical protein
MADLLVVAAIIVAFVVLGLMAAGCDRVIGPSDDDAVPGGLDDEAGR